MFGFERTSPSLQMPMDCTAFPYCRHGDGMTFFLGIENMGQTGFMYCRHGEGMMFLRLLQASLALKEVGGWGGRSPPPMQMLIIRATFPYCRHGDEMVFVFSLQACVAFKEAGGLGRGGGPPKCKCQCVWLLTNLPESEN